MALYLLGWWKTWQFLGDFSAIPVSKDNQVSKGNQVSKLRWLTFAWPPSKGIIQMPPTKWPEGFDKTVGGKTEFCQFNAVNLGRWADGRQLVNASSNAFEPKSAHRAFTKGESHSLWWLWFPVKTLNVNTTVRISIFFPRTEIWTASTTVHTVKILNEM